jgi:outer membrane immunogenic protein
MRYVQTKLLLTSAIVSAGLINIASAADLPARTYTKAPPIVQAAYDWSGFYIGINGGGATSRIDWNADGFGDEGRHDASGGTVGGQIGYRWELSSWVFGVEAQGNWADFKGSNASLQFPGQVNQTKIDSFGLFTGQIGYAWDRTLFYVKGGGAVTDNKYTAVSTLPPLIGIDTARDTIRPPLPGQPGRKFTHRLPHRRPHQGRCRSLHRPRELQVRRTVGHPLLI